MWKNGKSLRAAITFFPHRGCVERRTFPQADWKHKIYLFFHRLSFHIPQPLWRKLQTRVDIGRNVPNVVLHDFVATLEGDLHLADGIENGGMVLSKLLTDIRQA